jgi:hypothetical protein
MAKPAVTTPAPRRSPARPAAAGSGWPAMPATDASQTPCTSGRSADARLTRRPRLLPIPTRAGRERTRAIGQAVAPAGTSGLPPRSPRPGTGSRRRRTEEATRRDTALHASPLKPCLDLPIGECNGTPSSNVTARGKPPAAPHTVHHFSERAMLRSFMIKASHHGSGGYKVRLTSRGKPTSTRCGAYCALTGINPRCRNKPSHPGSG